MADKKDEMKKEKVVKEKPVKAVKEKKEPKAEKKKFHGKTTEPAVQINPAIDPFDTIKFVLMTEKSIRLVETQNKLVFIVHRPAKKPIIKAAVEQAFGSPVSAVKTMIDQSGRKKAFVKFKNDGAAGDIAIKLGII